MRFPSEYKVPAQQLEKLFRFDPPFIRSAKQQAIRPGHALAAARLPEKENRRLSLNSRPSCRR